MDFIYLFRLLLKRKWIIIGAGIIAASVVYYLTRNEPKKYKSSAQISTGFTINEEIKVTDENFDLYAADTKFNNVLVTATSPSVINLLSYTLILHDLKDSKPFTVLTDEQKSKPVYNQIDKKQAISVFEDKLQTMTLLTSFKPDEKKLLEFLSLYNYDYKSIYQRLSIYRLQRTDYIQIDYISKNPELSAFVVNNIFQQFLRYYKNVRSDKSNESIDTLRSLMEKKKQELDEKNALLREKGIVDVTLGSSSKLDLISTLEQTLTSEKSKLIGLNSDLLKINQKIAATGTVTKLNDNDEILILRNSMNDAYAEYLNSGSTNQALYDRYLNLKKQYQAKMLALTPKATTNTNVNDLIVQKNDLEIDIQASKTTIASLQNQINILKGNVQSEASKGAAIETLLKDQELANTDYLAAKQRFNEAIDINSSAVNNFRQILYGQPAIEPEPSKRKLLVGMAGMAAILLSILTIIILAFLDSSIKTPIIFNKAVNLKLISLINYMNLKQKKLSDIVSSTGSEEYPSEGNRDNIFRESIRKLRYEIESTGKKIFLFTSTKKGQGKTTLIQALAYSLSNSKKKILIIDTNFCNNDLTVQLEANPVLETMAPITNANSIVEKIKDSATTVIPGLVYVIGSVGGDYTPTEILPRENILNHLEDLKNEFDYIFLEGPPLNDFTDSKELSTYVDGVIGVFSATESLKQIDKQSAQFFSELNGKFCGAILNMVDLKNVNVS